MLSPIHPVFLDIWPWENMAALVSHPLLPTGVELWFLAVWTCLKVPVYLWRIADA
jgi:hypothetical protein